MRISLRYQIVALLTSILLSSLGVYLYHATSSFSRDKLAYVYDVTAAMTYSKSEQVRASLTSYVDRLRFFSVHLWRDHDDREFVELSDTLFATDQDLLALEVWQRAGERHVRMRHQVDVSRIAELGLSSGNLIDLHRRSPLAFDAVHSEGLLMLNSSLPPDAPVLTLALAFDADHVIVADLHPQQLLRLFPPSELETTYMVGAGGELLLHSDPKKMIQRATADHLDAIRSVFSANVDRGVHEFVGPAGAMLGAFAGTGVGRAVVLSEVPKEAALLASRQLNRQTFLFAVLLVVIAIAAGIFFAHRVVAPLRALEVATASLGTGNFGIQVPDTSRNELGAVARAFNRMSAELADRETRYLTLVGTLAAGVAHEINNPLAYVLANIQYIKDVLERAAAKSNGILHIGGDERRDMLSALEDVDLGANRVKSIVQDLRNFSQSDRGIVSGVDVNQTLDNAIKMALAEIRYHAEVVRNYQDVPLVRANPSHLGQIFLNLLVNAAQALAEVDRPNKVITLTTRTGADGRAMVEIADNGPGIPEDVKGRIFDPFFTTKAVGVGSGLGLSICRTLVHRSGGTIEVANGPDGGATFRVGLPPAAAAQSEKWVQAGTTATLHATGGRILVVDDEPRIMEALHRILHKRAGTVMALGGRRALDILTEDRAFDLVLCDVMMPELDGIDLYEAVRAFDPSLARRFVFMTGGVFTKRSTDFLASVANKVVKKPFSVREIRALVESHASDAPEKEPAPA